MTIIMILSIAKRIFDAEVVVPLKAVIPGTDVIHVRELGAHPAGGMRGAYRQLRDHLSSL